MLITSKRRYLSQVAKIVELWVYNCTKYGGNTLTNNSRTYALNFLLEAEKKTWFSKIKYFLPMLGATPTAGTTSFPSNVALINRENKNPEGNPLVDSVRPYFEENVGYRPGLGDFVTFTTNYQTNTSSYGVGVYLCNTATSSLQEVLITGYNIVSSNTIKYIYSGSVSASYSNFGASNHYAQIQSSSLKLYYSGSLVAENTSSFSLSLAASNIQFSGENQYTSPNASSSITWGAVYVTDGTLTDNEISDFHSTIRNYLIIPTGKSGV